jgi:antitoxin Phd
VWSIFGSLWRAVVCLAARDEEPAYSYLCQIRITALFVSDRCDAPANFSRFGRPLPEGPQVVTLRGVEAAVLLSVNEWRDLRERARPSLKSLLLGHAPRGDLNIPPRGRLQRRIPSPIEA